MHPSIAQFYFHNSLNDFLPKARKDIWIDYTFNQAPAVKDAIEAIGIPHTEVEVILVNNRPVHFYYSLHPGDHIEVYPAAEQQWPQHYPVREGFIQPNRFVLDVHLGTLAKMLRLLGIDTCYQTDYSDADIVHIAANENRIVLTRDVGLLKHRAIIWGHWLRSQYTTEQVIAVIKRFHLADMIQPFRRCLSCNGVLVSVKKEDILNDIPPKAALYFDDFFQCTHCHRIYWKGSHYEHMEQTIANIMKQVKNDTSISY